MTQPRTGIAPPGHARLGVSLLLGATIVIASGVMLGFATAPSTSTSCFVQRGGWHVQAADTVPIEVASRWYRRTHWLAGV